MDHASRRIQCGACYLVILIHAGRCSVALFRLLALFRWWSDLGSGIPILIRTKAVQNSHSTPRGCWRLLGKHGGPAMLVLEDLDTVGWLAPRAEQLYHWIQRPQAPVRRANQKEGMGLTNSQAGKEAICCKYSASKGVMGMVHEANNSVHDVGGGVV
jgi:hypothetical protein